MSTDTPQVTDRVKVGWLVTLAAFGANVRVLSSSKSWNGRTDATLSVNFRHPVTNTIHTVYMDPATARALIDALEPHAAPANEAVAS